MEDFLGQLYLKAALAQTGWKGPEPTSANWTDLVAEKLEAIDWPKAVADAKPFVERIGDIEMISSRSSSVAPDLEGQGITSPVFRGPVVDF